MGTRSRGGARAQGRAPAAEAARILDRHLSQAVRCHPLLVVIRQRVAGLAEVVVYLRAHACSTSSRPTVVGAEVKGHHRISVIRPAARPAAGPRVRGLTTGRTASYDVPVT